ncbi:hypothetical protein SLA2020_441570 [Shorea laevis]
MHPVSSRSSSTSFSQFSMLYGRQTIETIKVVVAEVLKSTTLSSQWLPRLPLRGHGGNQLRRIWVDSSPNWDIHGLRMKGMIFSVSQSTAFSP